MAGLSASVEPFRVRLVQPVLSQRSFCDTSYACLAPTNVASTISSVAICASRLINTPLVALLICLYRHFVMSSLVDSNRLSLNNYLETLAIIAFLSFAIGLYWRFKFRSKYLAMELEETRLLNEELKKMQEPEQSSPNEMEKPE